MVEGMADILERQLSPESPASPESSPTMLLRLKLAACRTRNPGSNPSTSWAGLFTFSGGKLTTGPNGNGVSEQLSANQWTFTPNDPAQARPLSELWQCCF